MSLPFLEHLLFFPAITPLLLLLYFLPGFVLSRAFRGPIRNHPLFWVFLSLLFNPTLYSFLIVLFGGISLLEWVLAETVVLTGFYFLFPGRGNVLSTELLKSATRWRENYNWVLLAILFSFFLAVSYTKWGIFWRRTPIASDDFSHLPKIVAIATSPAAPRHFNYPLRSLSYYYYSYVSPGLLTRFSGNLSTVNRSFFLDYVLRTAVVLYLFWLLASYLFAGFWGKLAFLLPLTFFGGFELVAAFLTGQPRLFSTLMDNWPGVASLQSLPQVTNFVTAGIWFPHHVFSAAMAVFIFVLLFRTGGSRVLTALFLALGLTGSLGFGIFPGLLLFAATTAYLFVGWFKNRRCESLLFLLATLVLAAFFISPLFSLIGMGQRQGNFELSLSFLPFFASSQSWAAWLNFLLTVPIYYFLDLGPLFVGLGLAAGLLARKNLSLGRETVFWLLFLPPLIFVLLTKFSGTRDLDFNVRSRVLILSLISLAVFTGWAFERMHRKWRVILLVFYSLTFLSPLSELWQNWRTTQRAYTFFVDLDKNLPLNALVISREKVTPHYWQTQVFIHRPTVKPNYLWDQVDLQYTGLSAPPPDGLRGDDYSSVKEFLSRHPSLARDYHLYYLSQDKLDLPVVYQDLGNRLYGL